MTDQTAEILESAGLEVIGTLPTVGNLTTKVAVRMLNSINAVPFKVISPQPEYEDLDQVNSAWLTIAKDSGLLDQNNEFAIQPGGIKGTDNGPWYHVRYHAGARMAQSFGYYRGRPYFVTASLSGYPMIGVDVDGDEHAEYEDVWIVKIDTEPDNIAAYGDPDLRKMSNYLKNRGLTEFPDIDN